MTMFAQRLQEMVAAEGAPTTPPSAAADADADARPQTTAPAPPAAPQASDVHGGRVSDRDDEVLDVLALAGGMSWAKALPTGGALVSVVAALISVFAAGYASARARSANR